MPRKTKAEKKRERKREEKAAILSRCRKAAQRGAVMERVYAELAREFGRKPMAVRKLYQRNAQPKEKAHGNCVLTKEDEEDLLCVLWTFSMSDRDLSISQVTSILKSWKNLQGERAGEYVAANLLARHKGRFRGRYPKSISRARKDPGIVASMEHFIAAVDEENRSGRYQPFQIVTYDEFIASVPTGRSRVERVVSVSKIKANLVRGKGGKSPSICLFASAAGRVEMVVIVYPTKILKDANYAEDFPVRDRGRGKRGGAKFFYAFNKSGRMNNDLFALCAKKFVEVWELCHPGVECRLQGDRLAAHMKVEMVAMLLKKGIRCVWPPSKTTVFSAPLDDKAFAVLKNALTLAIEDRVNLDPAYQEGLTSIITDILPDVIDKCLTEKVLLSSFKSTGIYPWNPKLLRKRARQAAENSSPAPTPQHKGRKDLIAVMEELVTPPKSSGGSVKRRLRVKLDEVFTSEQVIAEDARKRKLLAAEAEEKGQVKVARAHKRALELGKREEKGRATVAKKIKRGGKVAEQWTDVAWLDAKTCRACRALYRGNLQWEAPDCEAFWYCSACKGKGRAKLEAHESECDECTKVRKNDKN